MSFFKVSSITSMERNLAVSLVSQTISKHQGWIVDHTFLSNLVATIVFEMPGNEISRFAATLEAGGIKAETDEAIPNNKKEDLTVILSLTFIHDEPELKREVPHFG